MYPYCVALQILCVFMLWLPVQCYNGIPEFVKRNAPVSVSSAFSWAFHLLFIVWFCLFVVVVEGGVVLF